MLILRVPSSEFYSRAAVTVSLIFLGTGGAMVLARQRREQVARRQELVLVVEDNPMTRRALIEGLEMLNYRAGGGSGRGGAAGC